MFFMFYLTRSGSRILRKYDQDNAYLWLSTISNVKMIKDKNILNHMFQDLSR